MSEGKRTARTLLALVALALLAGIVVTFRPSGLPIGREASTIAVRMLLIPLGLAAVGLMRRASWGEVTGLSIALAVLPWAFVLTVTPSLGAPITRQTIALAAAVLLLVALVRPSAGGRSEAWIRWCLVLNLASIFHLYMFVTAYRFGASWQLVVLGSLLAALVVGVGLLARQKTIGLLLLAASALLLVPGAALFVGAEARSPHEAVFFWLLFAPGILAAVGSVLVLGRPLISVIREPAAGSAKSGKGD